MLKKVFKGAEGAAVFAATMSAILAILKLIIFIMSGSLVVALSAWDSLGDSAVSLINNFVIKYARKRDKNHPYGRGKAENLAALAQSALIAGGAIAIAIGSITKIHSTIINGNTIIAANWYVVVFFVFCGAVSFVLSIFLQNAAKKHNSIALKGDSTHYSMDVFSNMASGVAIGVIIFTKLYWLDAVISLALAGKMIWSAYKLVRESMDDLMDHDISDEVKYEALKVITATCDKVVNIHNFRGRRSGSRILLDFHLTLPSSLCFDEVHSIVEQVEFALKKAFNGDCIIHPDPDSVPIDDTEVLFPYPLK